jgi:Uma2 family endonuclease
MPLGFDRYKIHFAGDNPMGSQILLEDEIPILYEDEEEEMGEANLHAWVVSTLYFALPTFFKNRQPALQVFQNLNCFYLPTGRPSPKTGCKPNFASDIMIVHANQPLPLATVVSYTIGVDGPVPKLVFEVLAEETKTRDMKEKLVLYAKLGIPEYIFVDLTGDFLPKKLELRRLQANGKWKIVNDAAGGVTSNLGFRLFIDDTDPYGLFIADAATGRREIRPHEWVELGHQINELARAEADRLAQEQVSQADEHPRVAAEARRLAEERLQALEAEMERLRGN